MAPAQSILFPRTRIGADATCSSPNKLCKGGVVSMKHDLIACAEESRCTKSKQQLQGLMEQVQNDTMHAGIQLHATHLEIKMRLG